MARSGWSSGLPGITPGSTQVPSALAVGSEWTIEMMDLSDASEIVLVVAIGRWNDSALAEVYRRHGGAVYGLARRVLGTDGRAEEVTQDVFVDFGDARSASTRPGVVCARSC